MFWQPELEERLEERARRQPTVEIRRSVELVALREAASGIELTVRGIEMARAPDGRREVVPRDELDTIHARYVVGCDGANSTVRDLVGATVTDLGFFYDWLIVDVALHERRFDGVNLQICDPARPTTIVSGGPGRRRWEFMRLPHESIEELNDETTAWQLLADWDVTPDTATLERHAVYTFQARWVDQWRVGRVLLAGDAAHQMPPFAGQGMCSGLRDAVNLAWKLDLALSNHAPDALLDVYGQERVENVCAVIEFSMELGKIICIADPEEAAARDALMNAGTEASGPQPIPPLPGVVAGIVLADDPLAGELFVQGRVSDGMRTGLFDDVVGRGWRLVTIDDELAVSIPADLQTWFSDIGGSVVTLGDVGLGDVDGTYTMWFEDHSVQTALQRPDFYLFGTAADGASASELLAALRAALAERPAGVRHSTTGGTQ